MFNILNRPLVLTGRQAEIYDYQNRLAEIQHGQNTACRTNSRYQVEYFDVRTGEILAVNNEIIKR